MTSTEIATMVAPIALISVAAGTVGTIARQARLADWARSLDLTESQKSCLRELWDAGQTTRPPGRDPLALLGEEERQLLWYFTDVVARPAEFNYPQRAEQHAEQVHKKVMATYVSRGFSQEHAHVLAGMVVNKLRVAIDSDRGRSILARLSRLPAIARYAARIVLAAGAAAAIHPSSWWLALTSIPLVMYASNIIHDEPPPPSAALAFDGVVYASVAAWGLGAIAVFVTSLGQWWAVVPGAVTAFVGYHSLLPGWWVEEYQAGQNS